MHDLLTQIGQMRRPRLLIRAARIASAHYQRATHLPRVLGYGITPRTGPALVALMALESDLDTQRKSGDAAYSIAAHVDVLTAVMGETQLLCA